MELLEIIRQTIAAFCIEYIHHPYLCYTEHGQHALFYEKLFNRLAEEQRYITWQDQKVCVIQKEYPTATDLGKPKRQHWDISVLDAPPKNRVTCAQSYDYLNLLAAIEFGMNESREHLVDDMERLSHPGANLKLGFLVHLYRLSDARCKFSRRDWSPRSRQIISAEDVSRLSAKYPVEVYYAMANKTCKPKNGVWYIQGGKIKEIDQS